MAERKKIGVIKCGDIAVTPAFKLKAKYIIHTVAPAWEGGDKGEFDTLKSCYSKSLEKAHELGCNSIAFPLIATGVYKFPKSDALRIAMDTISSFLMREDVDMNVKLVVFDDKAFRLSKNLFFQVESFINDDEVIKAHQKEYGLRPREFELEKSRYRRELDFLRKESGYFAAPKPTGSYDDSMILCENSIPDETDGKSPKQFAGTKPFNEHTFDKNLYMNDGKQSFPFRDHLMDLLNKKNIDNIVAYKSSNIDRKAFAKILSGDTKNPQKRTVLAFCIGLKLSMEESQELLASADLAFNPYDKRDKLVRDCIISGQYNIGYVNDMLYACKQPQLGLFVKD